MAFPVQTIHARAKILKLEILNDKVLNLLENLEQLNLIKLLEKETNSIDAVDELAILPPRKPTNLSQLRGKLNLKMTVSEIDELTKSWRNEW